jgi:hypothetical protein
MVYCAWFLQTSVIILASHTVKMSHGLMVVNLVVLALMLRMDSTSAQKSMYLNFIYKIYNTKRLTRGP